MTCILQGDDGYEELDPDGFEIRSQPIEYEQPAKRRVKLTPPKPTATTSEPSDSNYDIPDGIEGLTLDSSTIQITTSHALKLPAEYNEVPGISPNEYQNLPEAESEFNGSYHMLESNMSPTSSEYYQPTPPMEDPVLATPSKTANVRPSRSKKAMTFAASQGDYEVPVDAEEGKRHTIPAHFPSDYGNDDYETPLDAST